MTWLKFESSLPEKPETLAITGSMGWTDPDLTVGKLMKVFRWFDEHTVDGNAAGVTEVLLDHIIGVTGFAKALVNVGWLVVSDAGLSLTNFDRHNGETAKSRALTAKRVANHRAKDPDSPPKKKRNAPNVTDALAREEKRREEKQTQENFDAFWSDYPKKVAKPEAFKAFQRLKPNPELLARIRAAVAVQRNCEKWRKNEGEYIPNPATYLNGSRWEDEVVVAIRAVDPNEHMFARSGR